MQTRNKIFDDLSQLMTNAMGVAQGAKDEAETAMKGWVDRWLAERDFVTREEFDAVRAMAQKAREENEALKARIAAHARSNKADVDAALAAEPADTDHHHGRIGREAGNRSLHRMIGRQSGVGERRGHPRLQILQRHE